MEAGDRRVTSRDFVYLASATGGSIEVVPQAGGSTVRVAFAVLLSFCSAALAQPLPVVPVAPEPHDPRAAPYIRDLKLTATTTAKTVKPFEILPVTLTLENISKTNSYFVVKASDGSECGWREPYVHFTAEQLWQGKWEAIPRQGIGRCGLYANEWWKDVVELKPGEKLVVAKGSYPAFRMPTDGKLRLRGYYEYRGGMNKSFQQPVENRGRMGDAPKFTLVSNTVELDVGRPTDARPRNDQR